MRCLTVFLAAVCLLAGMGGALPAAAQPAAAPNRIAMPPVVPGPWQTLAADQVYMLGGNPIEVAAKQAFLLDATTGVVLFAKNPYEECAPSSLTKMMTLYLTFERLASGALKLDTRLPVSRKAWRMGGSKMFIRVGSEVSVDDLIQGVVVDSGNDAAIALAQGIGGTEANFVSMMNHEAKTLGMDHTHFVDASGWPDPGHYSSMADLAILADHLIYDFPQYYHYFAEVTYTYDGIKQGNRNPLLYPKYAGLGVDGLKTGHTDEGGYGLAASAEQHGMRLIVLLDGMNSVNARAREGQLLLQWGFDTFVDAHLFAKGAKVTEAQVWLGKDAMVPLVSHQNVVVTMPRSAAAGLKMVATYDSPVPAPIVAGAPLANLVITRPDGPAVTVPLYAGATVPLLGGIGRLEAALRYLVWGAPAK